MKKAIMKRKILIITLSIAMVACLGTYSMSFAESISDKQDQMEEIEEQQEELEGDLSTLRAQLDEQQEDIDAVQAQVDAKQKALDETQANIDKIEAEMTERKEGLDSRIRTMYKNGSVGYLDILLSSTSVTEFLSNLEMVQIIYRNDQETLNTLKDQQAQLEEQETQLAEEKAALDQQQAELESKQAEIQKTKDALQAQYDQLAEEFEQLASEIEAAANAQSANLPSEYQGGVFQWPCNSTYITSWFGARPYPGAGGSTNHGGIDIGARNGSPIYAAADGIVTISGWYGGYGRCVTIAHGGSVSTLYGHCSSLAVKKGQSVKKGQVIAYVGSTGNSTGPHLHFSVFIGGRAVDPMNYFN